MSQVSISPLQTNPLLNKLFNNAGIAIEEPKKTWEELDGIYWVIAESIVKMGESVNSVINHLNIKKIDNIVEVTLIINGLRKDLEDITQTLIAIRQRYVGRTGYIKNESENNLCLDCFTDYQALSERHRLLVLQPLMTLTEVLADIDSKIKKENVTFTPQGDIEGEVVVVKE